MSILLVAEHNDAALNPVTLNVLAAAQAIGGDITVLVAGEGCGAAAEAAAALPGVSKVLSADAAIYGKQLAENVAPLIAEAAAGHSHVLSAHSTNGKNTMPRVAALLDVNMVSDIISVESEDTFKRPLRRERHCHGQKLRCGQGHHRASHGLRCRPCHRGQRCGGSPWQRPRRGRL